MNRKPVQFESRFANLQLCVVVFVVGTGLTQKNLLLFFFLFIELDVPSHLQFNCDLVCHPYPYFPFSQAKQYPMGGHCWCHHWFGDQRRRYCPGCLAGRACPKLYVFFVLCVCVRVCVFVGLPYFGMSSFVILLSLCKEGSAFLGLFLA